MKTFRLRILAQTLPFLLIVPAAALAQAPPSRTEATAAIQASANPTGAQFTRQQLDQMLAPIALYPDEVLSDVLMAATYPQQVLDADHWLQDPQHKDLKGDALAAALEPLPWHPSVKSLVPFPQIIAMMAEHIEWTQTLGTAFAEDQSQVMARVQALRQLAMKSGKLAKVHHLRVHQEGSEIVITSAERGRVYVPVYNPVVVYGQAWPDRDYPPVYLPPPQGFVAETVEPGLEVSVGYTVVAPLWGWNHPDWREHRITIERDEYTRISRNAEVPQGNFWVHTGPVTLVSPAAVERSTTVRTQVPTGTVAPGQAAAPRAVATHTTNTNRQTETTTPNSSTEQNRTAAQPPSNEAKPNSATANEPNRNAASTNPASTNESNRSTGTTNPAKTGHAATSPAHPAGTAEEPSKPGTSAANPAGSPTENAARHEQRHPGEAARTNNQPGKTGTGAANPATPTENAARHEQRHPGEATQTTHEPGNTGTSAVNPASPAGNLSRHDEHGRGPAHENAVRTPEHANAPAAHQEPGREHGAPAAGGSAESSRGAGQEANRPNAAQPPGTPPQPPHQAERAGPPHQSAPAQAEHAAPPHQPAPAQAERAAPPHQPPAQGSSTAPGEAAHQRPQGPGAAHEPRKPEEEPKKEH